MQVSCRNILSWVVIYSTLWEIEDKCAVSLNLMWIAREYCIIDPRVARLEQLKKSISKMKLEKFKFVSKTALSTYKK